MLLKYNHQIGEKSAVEKIIEKISRFILRYKNNSIIIDFIIFNKE
jgi:hypothetical protein